MSSVCAIRAVPTRQLTWLVVGTANNGTLHAFDVVEYQLLVTWSFDDVTGSTDHVTSIACSPTNQHVAVSAGQLVKVWDLRFAKRDRLLD